MNIHICKPYWKHLFEGACHDFKHQLHKWTAGIILVDHPEPDGRTAKEHHKEWLIL